MASRSRDALPVLEEWYDVACTGQYLCDRPRACGVVGCAEPLVKAHHLRYRLCPAHKKCPAVLRRGEPQRWCGTCRCFHTLEAFSGSQRCAPASRLQRAPNPVSPKIPFHSSLHEFQCASVERCPDAIEATDCL